MVVIADVLGVGDLLVAGDFGVIAAGALEVGMAGGLRIDGEERDELIEIGAAAFRAGRRVLENQSFETMAAALAFVVVERHDATPGGRCRPWSNDSEASIRPRERRRVP